MPELSQHFAQRGPSAIRQAQILFARRPDRDRIRVINMGTGNVSLPMHPAMQDRMRTLGSGDSPFAGGVVKYSATVGTDEAQRAFLHVIAGSTGADTSGLRCLVTDGGSMSMELMLLGVCGPGGDRPLLLIDPAYTNYMDMAKRCCVPTVAVRRDLRDDGSFALPPLEAIEAAIREARPRGVLVIPADNPTGQHVRRDELAALARLCVKHDLWIVSDEAYRELHYGEGGATSVWALGEADVPGITGRRIGIETASKVWNACGLRIGAIVTDSPAFHEKAVAEYTANLCANVIGQHIFGALAHVPHADLRAWYGRQRAYYAGMMGEVAAGLRAEVPGLVVSRPDAALYGVIDVRNVAPPSFRAVEFISYCAERGRVSVDGADYTMLAAPMAGFYRSRGEGDPSETQLRIAFVDPPAEVAKAPRVFSGLLRAFLAAR
jgi:aspartate aminotransferase